MCHVQVVRALVKWLFVHGKVLCARLSTLKKKKKGRGVGGSCVAAEQIHLTARALKGHYVSEGTH